MPAARNKDSEAGISEPSCISAIKTRIIDLCDGRYRNLSELAEAMGISVSQIYRVRDGKRNINQRFIIGAIRVFPEYKMDELFYFVPRSAAATSSGRQEGSRDKQAVKV